MTDPVIHVENLSKQYTIGVSEPRYSTLRDNVMERLRSLARRNGRGDTSTEAFWALKDVSFEVKRGEVLGLIGRNGAGKSTLLKILSRITEPSSGYARLTGRVGSLLEVGTGFHQELTGRENIYLNGAILGMKKAEITRKFDEIVAFAEVERFIDTPVKHYSSGMYLRLAFAVAAHLELEILLLDEVLAVGDVRFQNKCFNKMQDVTQQDRTVLFVSHNMPAITNLCKRTILLDEGRIVQDGPTQQVMSNYLNSDTYTGAVREWPDPAAAPGGEIARLFAVRVRSEDGNIAGYVDIRQPVIVEMEYTVLKPGYVLLPNFAFYNPEGVCLFGCQDLDPKWRQQPRPAGRYISRVLIPGNFLADGNIFVNADLNTMDPFMHQFQAHRVVSFEVLDSFEGDSARGDYNGQMGGVVRPKLDWQTQFLPTNDASVREKGKINVSP